MKKYISVILAAIIILLVFGGCRKNEEDMGWMVSLDYSDGSSWIYSMDKEGVMALSTREDFPGERDGNGSTVFIFEAVGQGETVVSFKRIDVSGMMSETIRYKLTVDENYVYTAELIEAEEESTTEAVSLDTAEEAEQFITEHIGVSDEQTGNEIVVELEKTYEEDGVRWYVFRCATVVYDSETGKTYLKFLALYAVNQFGEIKELDPPENTEDIEIQLK